jgi:multidrug efflux pump subunit AcrB
MKQIIDYFIKFPIAANLLMFALFIMGIVGALGMKSTFFPEVESRNISVQLVYPGASPGEIEEGVINKIEENLKGVTGIERITSTSRENAGTVNVEVFKGYDTDLVLQDVKNSVDRINSFPVGLEPPVVYKLENLGFAISFAISGEVDLKTLKRYGRQAEDDLLAMDGISKVALSGFPDEEIEIAFRESDLRAYNITFQQATLAVRAANLELTGGTLKGEKEELLIRARNKSYYAQGLRDIVVKTTAAGSVIRLHQIADIRDKWADNPNRSFMNGKPSVVVTVQNTLEEDMITITDLVQEYIEQFNVKNTAVQATVIRDGSVILRQRIALLTENGIIGFLIVVVLLAMFLHWRLAFWVAIAIPISFAGMFICANALGITINVISLFGMILVIGILVDDGIVIGENIYQEYEKGVPRLQAALNGTMQVLPAVFAAIITTVVAFSSFLFIDGRLGDFFSEMAIVVIFSLVFSLIEGAFILPTHVAHSKALSPNRSTNRVQEAFEKLMILMRDKTYAPVLRFAMKYKILTASTLIAILIITFGAIGGGIIGTTFFPNIERDNIAINLQMPAGTREHLTMEALNQIEEAAIRSNAELSEQYFNNEKQAILKIEKNLGPTTYQGTINLSLLDGENRDSLGLRTVINSIRRNAGPMEQAEVVSYGSQSAFGKPISISLIGEDYDQLNTATVRIKEEMQALAELADVVDNNQEGLREINISLKEKARFLGLNLQEIVGQVRSGFFGSEVQRLQRGRDEVRVWVRYDQTDRKNITQLEDMRIRFADGREFPLSEIANLTTERGVISINHIDGKREVKIEADVASDEVSVSDLTALLKNEIIPGVLVDYPAVTPLFEGQNREQAKSQQSIQTVGLVVLALMFFIIALTFRSISQAIAVFLLIPFSFIGVGWGHWLMGTPISLFSFLGIIALIGILVNDALVFVSTYNQNLKDGMPQMDALFEAGISRFRPIVLTSFTTFAGLAPLLFEKSLQAQFLIPMAISVSYGLLAITVIILLLLPVLLIFTNRTKYYARYAWRGEKPTYEEVEAANRVVGVEE